MRRLFISAILLLVVFVLLPVAPVFADAESCITGALQVAKSHLGNKVALKNDARRYFSEDLFLRPIAFDLVRNKVSAAEKEEQIDYATGVIASVARELAKYADVKIKWKNSGGVVLGIWIETIKAKEKPKKLKKKGKKDKIVIHRIVVTMAGSCRFRDINVDGTKISSIIGDRRKLAQTSSK
ncbi:MAG: hypothetical protein G01um101456_396 [Parcubacteria group bacterium Gr01-1014_56]|nr:MAG: hypothetical protein G01um101456_396 [Parcubacteria group bacterium Gr01-1014_56]